MSELLNSIDWESIQFGREVLLWLLPLPLLMLLLPARRNKSSALYYPLIASVEEATSGKKKKKVSVGGKGFLGYLFLVLSWICVVVAAASPELVGEPEKKVKSSRDFLIAADISISMETKDWETDEGMVSRWDGVREVMSKFIVRREGDRMGLMVFGAQSFMQAPLSPDLTTVNLLLQETEVGMAGNQTAIGNCIAEAAGIFAADSIEQKVMLLLTDGQDSGSEVRPIQAARLAAADSIKIYALGIGDPNATVYDLDEETLGAIAEATGGMYFNAADPEQLEKVYEELDLLEPIEYEDDDYVPKRLLFYYPLAAGMLLLFIYFFFRSSVAVIRTFKRK